MGGTETLNRIHINDTGTWYQDAEGNSNTPDGKKLVPGNPQDWVYIANPSGQIPERANILYDANGGVGEVSDSNNPYIVGSSATILPSTDMSKENYSFASWNTKADSSGVTYLPNASLTMTENIKLYAQWNINRFAITYQSNGSSVVTSQTVNYQEVFEEPEDPIRTGYTFGGWFTDKDLTQKYDFSTLATQDITVYAQWDKKPIDPTVSLPSTGIGINNIYILFTLLGSLMLGMNYVLKRRENQ